MCFIYLQELESLIFFFAVVHNFPPYTIHSPNFGRSVIPKRTRKICYFVISLFIYFLFNFILLFASFSVGSDSWTGMDYANWSWNGLGKTRRIIMEAEHELSYKFSVIKEIPLTSQKNKSIFSLVRTGTLLIFNLFSSIIF